MAKLVLVSVVAALLAACYGALLVGGPKALAVDDDRVNEALATAIYEYNKVSNDMYKSRAVKVLNATTQVVNGVRYDIFVEIGRTKCRKTTVDVNGCEFYSEPSLSKTTTCHFAVVNRSWASEIKVIKSECN